MFSFDQYPPLMLTFLNLPPKVGAAADLFFTPIIAQIGVRKQSCKIEKNPFRTLIPPWNSVKGGNSCVVIKWHLQENTKIILHGKTISRVFLQGCEKSIVNTKGKSMVLNDVIDVVCTKEFVMLKENIENEGRK